MEHTPPTGDEDAEIYRFPTPKERAMRRHPASGTESIDEALAKLGIESADEDHDDMDDKDSEVARNPDED